MPTCLKKSGLLDSTPSHTLHRPLAGPPALPFRDVGEQGDPPHSSCFQTLKGTRRNGDARPGHKARAEAAGYPPRAASAQTLAEITPLASRLWGTTS